MHLELVFGQAPEEAPRVREDVRVSLDLAAVVVPKASDVLAARLREMILSSGLAEGTPLPTERELVTQSGLSRASVREALRVLETEGLVVTRAGRDGGSQVRRRAATSSRARSSCSCAATARFEVCSRRAKRSSRLPPHSRRSTGRMPILPR